MTVRVYVCVYDMFSKWVQVKNEIEKDQKH